MKRILILLTLLLSTNLYSAPPKDEAEYLKPFATLTGSMANSGWFQSASIDKDFHFYIGLPINLVNVGGADRSYEKTYKGGLEDKPYIKNYASATIWSDHSGASVKEPIYGLDGNIADYINHELSDGMSALADFSMLPFPTLQLGFSTHYTELKLRYIGMPTIQGIGFHFPAFGLQHDFGKSLIKKNLPVDLSVATSFTFPSYSIKPAYDENDKDQLTFEASGLVSFVGLVVGKKFKNFEIFAETGWEYSGMSFKGEQKLKGNSNMISYDEDLVGRNNFKIAINVSASLGAWLPILSQNFGANFGNTINIISFQK